MPRSIGRLRRRKEPRRVSVAERIALEVERQNETWGSFNPRRPSVRLGFACLEDELKEAFEAYEDDRHDDFCGLGFMATQEELIQVAAVAQRLVEAFGGELPADLLNDDAQRRMKASPEEAR